MIHFFAFIFTILSWNTQALSEKLINITENATQYHYNKYDNCQLINNQVNNEEPIIDDSCLSCEMLSAKREVYYEFQKRF